MFELGLSSCGKKIDDALLQDYKACGINVMEVSVSTTEEHEQLDLKNIKVLSEKHGIKLWSAHLPFGPFSEIDISEPKLAETTVSYFAELIKTYAEIGVNLYIIHPSGEPIAEEKRSERMECAKASLKKLAEIAESFNGVIAVENLPRTCLGRDSADILELVSADDRLRVCFDTNHLLKENPIDFIKNVGDKIITLHVSDYDFVDEKHWLPGEGDMDWQSLISELKAVGYNGPWLYEIAFECPKTISRPRSLNCKDFSDNAKALFEGKEPPEIV